MDFSLCLRAGREIYLKSNMPSKALDCLNSIPLNDHLILSRVKSTWKLTRFPGLLTDNIRFLPNDRLTQTLNPNLEYPVLAGSPLGIFLTLRRVNPSKGRGLGTPVAARLMLGAAHLHGDGLPAVERMYNLYHPFDPVGFRSVNPKPLP